MDSKRRLLERVLNWAPVAVVLGCVVLLRRGARLPWLPPPVTIARADKVAVYSWETLVAIVLITSSALVMALTTSVGPKKPSDPSYQLRSYARSVGWIIGIGGWIAAARLLLILLRGAGSQ